MRNCDGVVYKLTDLDTGEFYIGQTQHHRWLNGYSGSGRYWKEHCNKHPNHEYKRELLHQSITSFDELYSLEIEEIRKYCVFDKESEQWVKADNNMLNEKLSIHPDPYICTECGHSPHLKTCSKYKLPSSCPECGGLAGKHFKKCSKYKDYPICPECNSTYGHKKTCSFYTKSKPCPECGIIKGHKKSCSKYIFKKPCDECGSIGSRHLKSCSKYHLKDSICLECKGKNGQHKANCSKRKVCSVCGSTPHKSNCPVAPRCSECGASTGHLSHCSKSHVCTECGGRNYRHKKGCSEYKIESVCDECGGPHGRHLKDCSKYTEPKPCLECGKTGYSRHKHWCSKRR